uniref:Beta-lactamase n=1 Tax=Shewanella algae TaxID=38313 RepID=Q8KQN5_9GAMM|nr:cephalosporinase [Shewanella algae]
MHGDRMINRVTKLLAMVLGFSVHFAMAETPNANIQSITDEVDQQAGMLMEKYHIPGMAIAISIGGEQHFYHYGMADVNAGIKVSRHTLFELGSISKTFTRHIGQICTKPWSIKPWEIMQPSMRYLWEGTPIGNPKLINLATYTPGGVAAAVSQSSTPHDGMLGYYKAWQPEFAAGTHRLYSNPSIGLYGYLAALSMKREFSELMEQTVLPQLAMNNTFVKVPITEWAQYAFWFYAKNEPVRVSPGMLDAQAYCVKFTSADMLHYLEANMGLKPLSPQIAGAIKKTHKGYYDTSSFTQALGWEIYEYPLTLSKLLEGNSREMASQPTKVKASDDIVEKTGEVWINKTGSTGGFGAYVAFIPAKKLAIVMLANKNYPISARVEAAYKILTAAQE